MAKTGAKKKAAKKTTSRKKKVEPASRGLSAQEVASGEADDAATALATSIADDGGSVLATYRDPLGGAWQLLASLPIDKVTPTPFQRDLSATHAKRMGEVLDRLNRFLDPIIAVRTESGEYWTPNGLHRLTALRELGGKSIVAIVVPDFALCYKILALNTERAHNLKEKALEVIRMARSLAEIGAAKESDYALEFEEASLLTVGLCYEQRARFAGSAYNPILKRCDTFSDEPMGESLTRREALAARVLEIDDAVAAAVKALKERGFDSPYLKNFVVARINPVRARSKEVPELDEVLTKMAERAASFDPGKVSEDQIAKSG